MQVRQPFQTRADVMKLVNFFEDSFKSHGYALFIRAKWKKTSDGLLSSEDLKEEKVLTTPPFSIRDMPLQPGIFTASGANRLLAPATAKEKKSGFNPCLAFWASSHNPA